MKRLIVLQIIVLSYLSIDDCLGQAFVRYAKQGNVNKVKELLNKGVDSTAVNEAFFEAAFTGDINMMNLLIENGANINSVHRFFPGDTTTISPITHAVRAGNIRTIKFLLEHDANLNVGSSCTPLEYAFIDYYRLMFTGKIKTKERFIEIVTLLLDHGANPNDFRNNNPWKSFGFPIIKAIYYSEYDLIDLLLDHGADININYASGNPPLLYAITYFANSIFSAGPKPWDNELKNQQSRLEMVKYLISKGAIFPPEKAIYFLEGSINIKEVLVTPDSLNTNKKLEPPALITPGYYSFLISYFRQNEIVRESGKPIVINFKARAGVVYLILPKTSSIGENWWAEVKEVLEYDFDKKEIHKR